MCMMELVEQQMQKFPGFADILIPEEMKGMVEEVDWDMVSRPKETKMGTHDAELLDGEWMDGKASIL